MNYTANDIVSLSAGRAFREKIGYSKYLIFDDGNIYSKVSHKNLKPIKKSTGYYAVNLYDDNGNRKMFFIHQLVAEAFLPNLNHYTDINHKDENKANNAVENLEWCTQKHNVQEARRYNLREYIKGKDNANSKKVGQYDLKGNLIKIWDCIMDIQRQLGFKNCNISLNCQGKRKTAYGFKWRYIYE